MTFEFPFKYWNGFVSNLLFSWTRISRIYTNQLIPSGGGVTSGAAIWYLTISCISYQDNDVSFYSPKAKETFFFNPCSSVFIRVPHYLYYSRIQSFFKELFSFDRSTDRAAVSECLPSALFSGLNHKLRSGQCAHPARWPVRPRENFYRCSKIP